MTRDVKHEARDQAGARLSAKSAIAVWIAGSIAGWAVIILAVVALA